MVISVWAPSIREAHSLIERLYLANSFVQFVEDKEMRHAYWVVFKLTNRSVLKDINNHSPRLTVMGI